MSVYLPFKFTIASCLLPTSVCQHLWGIIGHECSIFWILVSHTKPTSWSLYSFHYWIYLFPGLNLVRGIFRRQGGRCRCWRWKLLWKWHRTNEGGLAVSRNWALCFHRRSCFKIMRLIAADLLTLIASFHDLINIERIAASLLKLDGRHGRMCVGWRSCGDTVVAKSHCDRLVRYE